MKQKMKQKMKIEMKMKMKMKMKMEKIVVVKKPLEGMQFESLADATGFHSAAPASARRCCW